MPEAQNFLIPPRILSDCPRYACMHILCARIAKENPRQRMMSILVYSRRPDPVVLPSHLLVSLTIQLWFYYGCLLLLPLLTTTNTISTAISSATISTISTTTYYYCYYYIGVGREGRGRGAAPQQFERGATYPLPPPHPNIPPTFSFNFYMKQAKITNVPS